MSRRTEQEPSREEMLAYIKAARRDKGINVMDIYGYGPGTGFDPDISQGSDILVKTVFEMTQMVERYLQGEENTEQIQG